MKSKHTEITQGTTQGTIQRIEAQIEKIEGLIEQLLTGIDLSELTTKERLTLIPRFMALSQRAIAMKQTNLIGQPENEEVTLITQFMAYMRGESEEETFIAIEPSQDNTV